MKTAFVFTGGGSLGAVQVGMLKAVSAADIVPDFLVGSSVGAINAAFFASKPTHEGVLHLETIWRSIRRSDIFKVTSLGALLGIFSLREYVCSPKPLSRLIEKHTGHDLLEELALPCHIVTTDLFTGVDVSFSRGPIMPALLASAAIPTVFPPVRIENHYLVDGGVTNKTPISVAAAAGAERIIVFPTGMSCGLKKPPRRLIEMALQMINIATSHRLVLDIEQYNDKIEIIALPTLCPLDVSIFNFSRTGELIDRAENNVATWLAAGGLKPDPSVVEALRPHYH